MAVVIDVVRGDITTLEVDAIVNAANRSLVNGAGVCGAIHAAAGAIELSAACRRIAPCPPGQAKATPGFKLAARWIIHTVGPIWHGGSSGEPETLANCYRSSLDVADELGATSIAFPAISTGVYGFPQHLAAEIAVATITEWGADTPSSVERVVLVAFDEATARDYRALVGRR